MRTLAALLSLLLVLSLSGCSVLAPGPKGVVGVVLFCPMGGTVGPKGVDGIGPDPPLVAVAAGTAARTGVLLRGAPLSKACHSFPLRLLLNTPLRPKREREILQPCAPGMYRLFHSYVNLHPKGMTSFLKYSLFEHTLY